LGDGEGLAAARADTERKRMNQENWQEAKQIFNDALKLPADERAEYLDKISSDNPSLGEQVKTLLESYESGFLEETAVHKVAEIISGNSLKVGQQIGRYEIKEILGTGGMGEVFLAEDLELRRPVAIKVLHAEVAEDKERVSRFIQEARAASALNHPNILTIHEIGKFEDSRFIVSEYVKGETLRRRLKRENLDLPKSLEITAQVAAALEAAHEAGIIHRDIKPENIIVRGDGLVKVLDFGLAKLSEPLAVAAGLNSEASTLAEVRTNPGVVMGTIAYMSPEQARGVSVDARTDIWSLGVVLYEMLSGKMPFPGETTSDIIASILKTEAEPFENLDKEIPRELEEICFKALAKDPIKRYQTAQEFLQDLKRAKKHLESASEQTTVKKFNYADERKTELTRHRPTVSAEYIVTSVKRHKFLSFGALILLTFFGIGVGVYKFTNVPKSETSPFTASQKLNIAPLVTSGKVREIAVSPDGKYAAYVTANGDKQSIRVRQIATTSEVEIVTLIEGVAGAWDLSFSSDSNYLFYCYGSYQQKEYIIYKVPVFGGSPAKVVGGTNEDLHVTSGAKISPDGKKIVFLRAPPDNSNDSLQIANVDGSDERILTTVSPPNWIVSKSIAWSPDGKTVAYGVSTKEKDGINIKLIGINVSDGSQQQLSESVWSGINGTVWLSDGNLIVSGKEKGDTQPTPSQLWLIAPNTLPQPITNDRYGYSGVSVTAKGDVLMALQSKTPRNLWIVPNNDAFQAKQITSGGEIEGGVSWTPDGKLLFGSIAGGNRDIWMMNANGTDRRQLTVNQGNNGFASMTRDGRYIIFHSNRVDSTSHVFRMDADGRNPKQLTNGRSDERPRVSKDGKWVYYLEFSVGDLSYKLCKVSIDGGDPIVIATMRLNDGIDISPLNGLIAYVDSEDFWEKGGQAKIIIISPDDDKPIKTLLLPRTSSRVFIKWTPDERAIAFNDSRKGDANIWAIPVDGKGEAKPLTNFTTEQTFGFDWSPDGKQLVAIRGTQTSEAVLITRAR
jgi:eukaryotic-like serine/threonine-protein kinase